MDALRRPTREKRSADSTVSRRVRACPRRLRWAVWWAVAALTGSALAGSALAGAQAAGVEPSQLERDGMVLIPAGKFQMGSQVGEPARNEDEGPVHWVQVASFALARHLVTRAQYAAFVAATGHDTSGGCWLWSGGGFALRAGSSWQNPGFAQTDADPAVCVNWQDATAYAAWLSGKTGVRYRLPSEAEWEYTARAGTSSFRFWGDSPTDACRYANVADQTARRLMANGEGWTIHECNDGHAYTSPVGQYLANGWGLYDMLGNVWEWVEDCYHTDYQMAPVNGEAWESGECSKRVLRGGSWAGYPDTVRSALRLWYGSGIRMHVFGFRLAESLPH